MKPIMKPRTVYPPQDAQALGRHYLRHLEAMTAEALDGKAEIAEQLAWRDQRIEELESQLATADEELEQWHPDRSGAKR